MDKKFININKYLHCLWLGASSSHIDDPTLKNCLFDEVTVTKNADIDNHGYSGYGIGFDRRGSFSFPGGGYGQNALIFRVDMGFTAHISIRNRSNTRIKTYVNCKKNVFH